MPETITAIFAKRRCSNGHGLQEARTVAASQRWRVLGQVLQERRLQIHLTANGHGIVHITAKDIPALPYGIIELEFEPRGRKGAEQLRLQLLRMLPRPAFGG